MADEIEQDVPRKSAEQIARDLRKIFRKDFGGKPNGRFQMGRVSFRKLCGRQNLRDSLVQEVADQLLDYGFVLTHVGDFVAIQKVETLRSFRRVPTAVRMEFTPK